VFQEHEKIFDIHSGKKKFFHKLFKLYRWEKVNWGSLRLNQVSNLKSHLNKASLARLWLLPSFANAQQRHASLIRAEEYASAGPLSGRMLASAEPRSLQPHARLC